MFDATRSALVLGSAQSEAVVHDEACARLGIEVVRRRSGGGAVLLDPGEAAWIDVVLPTDHPLAEPDVGRAAWWVGEVWADALRTLGVGAVQVHRGAMVRTPWSALVCFAGVGPGEVLIGDGKCVGISQRRTRTAARFQTAAALTWRPERLVGLLSPPFPTGDEAGSALLTAVTPVARDQNTVVDAFLAALAAHAAPN